jgi:hypothetical protein
MNLFRGGRASLGFIVVVVLVVAGVVYAGFAENLAPASQSTGIATTSTSLTSTPPASAFSSSTPSSTAVSTFTSSTSAVLNLSTLVGGPGEAWILSSNYSEPSQLSKLTAAWNSYFSQPDFFANRAKFHWNLIRLSFCFADICGDTSDSLDVHSANGTTPDLSWLDAVIDICNQNGMRVMLAEFTFTGSSPDTTIEASTFLADWGLLAHHENGNQGVALYQIANEIEDSSFVNSNYGSLDGFLAQVTGAIRTYEPNKAVAWITAPPYIPNEPSVYHDSHVSAYLFNSSGEFSQCLEPSQISSWPNMMVSNNKTYGVSTINGEINAQEVLGEPLVNGHPVCDTQARQWITQMMSHGIPYILWEYSQYRSNWDYILNGTSFVEAVSA